MSVGKPKVTSSDRETARQLVSAIEHGEVEEVARILAFVRDQTISCALVDARREREREAAGHAAWCRTEGCDGSCREEREGPVPTSAPPWSKEAGDRGACLRGALDLLDKALAFGRHGLLVRAREEITTALFDLDHAREHPDSQQLRRSLALLYDAACYPNADIGEAQIESARDTIAIALGLKKARMTKVVRTRKRGPEDKVVTKGKTE